MDAAGAKRDEPAVGEQMKMRRLCRQLHSVCTQGSKALLFISRHVQAGKLLCINSFSFLGGIVETFPFLGGIVKCPRKKYLGVYKSF